MTQSRTSISAATPLRIRNAVGVLVSCHAGRVWITQEGDSRDVVIEAGEGFRLDCDGLALVTAEKRHPAERVAAAEVSLEPPDPSAVPQRRSLLALPRRYLTAALMSIVACFSGCAPGNGAQDADASTDAEPPRASRRAGETLLRIAEDNQRGRLWVLGTQSLQLYGLHTRSLIADLPLPKLAVSLRDGVPDIALHATTGFPYIADPGRGKVYRAISNLEGESWQIVELPISYAGDARSRPAFGALHFDQERFALIAGSAQGGTLWEIDLVEQVAHPLLFAAQPSAKR